MEYIERKIDPEVFDYLNDNEPRGVILAGIIGVGKTTLAQRLADKLKIKFRIFNFTGDDIQFRQSVADNSYYLIKNIRSQTNERALVIVDEIQKTPEILDSVKLAFDEENISFIVTGSEPQYLLKEAKKRLQRRARSFFIYPLGLNEIYSNKKFCDKITFNKWFDLLNGKSPDMLLDVKGDWNKIREDFSVFRHYGTIPLVYREKSSKAKLISLANIIDRGYVPVQGIKQEEADTILNELAKLNNREFKYQTILNKTRFKRREKINNVIDFYINSGVLTSKRRKLFIDKKSSYHIIYSFVDPGLAFYITKNFSGEGDNGFDLESIVFSQIKNWRNSFLFPYKISYFTPYLITPSEQIKYKDGEIDFIIEAGKTLIPIEVKANNNINNINVPVLKNFIRSGRSAFGIVFYQGAPWLDKKNKIYYLPLALL